MRYDSGQFGAFDGLDNRKTVMSLFVRMGRGVPEEVARKRRQGFLQALLDLSDTFTTNRLLVTPCSAAEAYHLFTAVTGCLGVDVTEAAQLLERVVRRLEAGDRRLALCDPRRGG